MNELGLTPYAERKIQFLGLRELGSCTLKVYSVVYGEDELNQPKFDKGLELASSEIPPADASNGRLGVGFAILHQGQTGDYVVLSWWDRENELPTRVYLGENGLWRPANANESFCVWDLEVIWFEREAYLKSILCRTGASISDYLDAHFAHGLTVTQV